MAALVTLAEARTHCHLTGTAYDTDLQQKMDAATALIVDRLRESADPLWTETTVPRHIHHAVLLVVDFLYYNRGDDADQSNVEAFWGHIDNLLQRSRDWLVA
jgi:Phage gp6-like head-tail connector protein